MGVGDTPAVSGVRGKNEEMGKIREPTVSRVPKKMKKKKSGAESGPLRPPEGRGKKTKKAKEEGDGGPDPFCLRNGGDVKKNSKSKSP